MIILCFNPLPHAEGDSAAWKKPATWLCFNPLPHAEGDVASDSVQIICINVSIHSLTQRETQTRIRSLLLREFQSTPSRRGRHTCRNPCTDSHCFNPLPHAEGDMARAVVYGITGVSIHSLTQRETALPPYSFPASCVSIHSLTQRETASRLTYPVEVNGFNPLPHAEGDHV